MSAKMMNLTQLYAGFSFRNSTGIVFRRLNSVIFNE